MGLKAWACKLEDLQGCRGRLGGAVMQHSAAAGRPSRTGWQVQLAVLRLLRTLWSAVHLHAALQPAGLPRGVPAAPDRKGSKAGEKEVGQQWRRE